MATKKAKDTKTNKSKKTTSKPKTTKKDVVKEEPVVDAVEFDNETKNIVFKKEGDVVGEVEVAAFVDVSEKQITEMQKVADEDDAKFEYAQAVLENVQEVTQQEKTVEENVYEYDPTTDENGSITVSEVEPVTVTEETSPETCIEEKQVEELVKPEPIKKKYRTTDEVFGHTWMGMKFD